MILVDTNAWIHHLRRADASLVRILIAGRARTCDVVIGELLLGSGLPKGFVKDLSTIGRLPSPRPPDTRHFIERHLRTFSGSGIGWADAQVLHIASGSGAKLYTSDRAMRRVAPLVGVALA